MTTLKPEFINSKFKIPKKLKLGENETLAGLTYTTVVPQPNFPFGRRSAKVSQILNNEIILTYQLPGANSNFSAKLEYLDPLFVIKKDGKVKLNFPIELDAATEKALMPQIMKYLDDYDSPPPAVDNISNFLKQAPDAKMTLFESENKTVQAVHKMNKIWGWPPTYGTPKTKSFEDRLHVSPYSDIYAITNITDALFRYLYYYSENNADLARINLWDKLNQKTPDFETMTDQHRQQIQTFLGEFYKKARSDMDKLTDSLITEYTSLEFRAVVLVARTIKSLMELQIKKVEELWHIGNRLAEIYFEKQESLSRYIYNK
jgi:hypothetical protein